MPRRAILCVGCLMTSVPATLMLPLRRSTRPRMDFRVVVRPAPLRPSRVMTSPSLTVRSMPCRTWDPPYQAFSFSTCSKLRAPLAEAASGTGGSHDGYHDGFIPGEFLVRTFAQHFPLLQ